MTMGDRVAVMNGGHLQQVDTPQVLYEQPVNEFVAGFIGSPAINLVEGTLERDDGRLVVAFGDHRLAIDEHVVRNRSGLASYVGRPVILGIRPEAFEDASLETDAPADRRLRVTCSFTEPLGSEVLVHFSTGARRVVASAVAADVGADAEVSFATGDDETHAEMPLVARVSPKTRIAEGSQIELAVDTSRLYFFDPESRAAI
jgi:multiple sugar transport system ATP-binding protein